MKEIAYRLEEHPEFGFKQIKPTPTPEEIARFYAEEFYSSSYVKFNNSALEVQVADKEFLDGRRADMIQHVQRITGEGLVGKTVLDVGCGWGQALAYFKEQGADCYGFDPAPEAVKFACQSGMNVVVAGMDRMDVFDGKRFDIVTLFNVLEHLADPVAVLRQIRTSVLKPRGLIIIEVPNEFNAFQMAGRTLHDLNEWWVAPPGHLNYFDGTTLIRLIEGCGYEVKLTEASFPLEMFLLFGENYVKDRAVGKICHQRRVAFELNLRKMGYQQVLQDFYQSLAKINLGRQVTAYAVMTGSQQP